MAFSETRAAEGGGPYAAFYRWTKPQGPPPWAARFPLCQSTTAQGRTCVSALPPLRAGFQPRGNFIVLLVKYT